MYMADYPVKFVLEALKEWPLTNKWFPVPAEIVRKIRFKELIEQQRQDKVKRIDNFLSTFESTMITLKTLALDYNQAAKNTEDVIISKHPKHHIEMAAQLVPYGFNLSDALVVAQNSTLKSYIELRQLMRSRPSDKIIDIRKRRLRFLQGQAKKLLTQTKEV